MQGVNTYSANQQSDRGYEKCKCNDADNKIEKSLDENGKCIADSASGTSCRITYFWPKLAAFCNLIQYVSAANKCFVNSGKDLALIYHYH
jgi:hypothetical protein